MLQPSSISSADWSAERRVTSERSMGMAPSASADAAAVTRLTKK